MAVNDGPQPVDLSAVFQNKGGSGGGSNGGGGGGEEDNNPITEAMRKALTKYTGVKIDSLFKTGIFAQFDSKGFMEGPINKGAAALNVKGGAGTEFLAKALQIDSRKDFSKLGIPENLPRLEVKDAPVDTSGSLSSSSNFAGAGGRGGAGEGIA